MTARCLFVVPPHPAAIVFDRRVGLVIPAYNEASHLPDLIARCRAVGPAVVVVVDDASTDGTGEVLERLAREGAGAPLVALRNRRNLGKQGTVRRGLRELLGPAGGWAALDAVALIDGDGQHDPAELPALAALLDEHDVVIGARAQDEMPHQRRLSNWAVNFGFKSLGGVDFVDVQSGLRLYRKELADVLAERLPIVGEYGLEYESLVALARHARARGETLRVAAAPIACTYRGSQSKIRTRHVVRLARETLRQAARLRLTELPPPPADGPGPGRADAQARAIAVEIHDVSPATADAVRGIHDALADLGVDRCSLLVVPAWGDGAGGRWDLRSHDAFAGWLRERRDEGCELVHHGLTHRGPGAPPPGLGNLLLHDWFAAGCEEFAFVTEAEARRRLAAGREILEACGLGVRGFVAPAWVQSPGTTEALAALGFAYTATLGHLRRLAPSGGEPEVVSAPALTFVAPNSAVDAGKRAVMRGQEALARPAPLLRVALHPQDVEGSRPIAHALDRLRKLLRYRRLVTTGEWLEGERSTGARRLAA